MGRGIVKTLNISRLRVFDLRVFDPPMLAPYQMHVFLSWYGASLGGPLCDTSKK